MASTNWGLIILSAERVLGPDFDEIEKWFFERDMRMPDVSLFPRVGFIVRGVAAGFIFYTDSLVAIIDGYISNPKSDARQRDEALDLITEALINNAKFHGIKVIKCDTPLDVVKKRALKFGFELTGSYESFMRRF